MTNPLLELKVLGQSVWLDDIDRGLCWLHEPSAEKREGLISSVTSYYFDASQASKAKSCRSFRFEA